MLYSEKKKEKCDLDKEIFLYFLSETEYGSCGGWSLLLVKKYRLKNRPSFKWKRKKQKKSLKYIRALKVIRDIAWMAFCWP